MKKLGIAFVAFFIWIFANGFWEMAGAPSHYTNCQAISWAQSKNEGRFRPDEALALWILRSIKCG